MELPTFHELLLFIQRSISFLGVMIIFFGILYALYQFIQYSIKDKLKHEGSGINSIRLSLGRILILGLEFIVAADLIGTTTAPDYYSIGIVASIVAIRTILSFSINRELMGLTKKQ